MVQRKKDSYLYSSKSAEYFPDPDNWKLSEPRDFSKFSDLIASGEASERQHDEFHLRMMLHFIDSVDNDKQPELWVMKAFSKSFFRVLMGARWEDEFQLPWTEVSLPWSPAERKDLEVFIEIANSFGKNPTLKITEVINSAAKNNSMSYEKARAAYYKYKSLLNK